MDSVFSVVGSYVNWDVRSLLLFTTVFIIIADYIKNRHPDSFPPGPRALPILGNIFTLDYKKNHEFLTKLTERYGDVYSLRFGQAWVVVLNRFEVLKEALVNQKNSVEDRPPLPLIVDMTHGQGILLTNGKAWQQQKRFALTTLRNFGIGKKSLEPVILDEFRYCAEGVKGYNGKPFNLVPVVHKAASNIISCLLFGHRFEYSHEKFAKLSVHDFSKSLQIQASIWAQFYNAFPFVMRYLPGPHQEALQIWEDTRELIREELKKHKQNWDPSDLRDYIDCYLNEIQMGKAHTDDGFNEENLVMCVLDLFVAGTETTSVTLHWALLYMAKYPEIQAKVQAEVDGVIGQSREPCLGDRANMPYTDAVLHEVQRIANVVPLNILHFTNRDIQLGGYTIPKGVTLIPNLTSVLYDKDEWETPNTFNPGHFLNKEGKFVKPPAFIPFSAGRRLCPGESLAKMELFLFFTSFMQHFTFSMPAGVKPVMDYVFGITLGPSQFEICATERRE